MLRLATGFLLQGYAADSLALFLGRVPLGVEIRPLLPAGDFAGLPLAPSALLVRFFASLVSAFGMRAWRTWLDMLRVMDSPF